MLPLAWGEDFIGHFMYSQSTRSEDLKEISGFNGKAGYYTVQPGKFGVDGKTLISLPEKTKKDALKKAMEKAIGIHDAEEKNTRRHIQQGRKEGVHWETEIPVTDSGGKQRKGK